jgi:hypothetical protein
MKSYLLACLAAAAAGAVIALGTGPRGIDAIAVAAMPAPDARPHAAWPAGLQAMARRPEHRWLLRAMSAGRAGGTLPPTPSEEPADPTSL